MNTSDYSRRAFIRKGTLSTLATGVGISNARALLADRRPLIIEKRPAGNPYKVGLLGCGNRCKAHIQSINEVADIEVAALCDILPHKMERRAELIKNAPQPAHFTSLEQMLREADLDAVAVLLPNHLHKDASIAALESGKHVFCEKPMALTVKDCNAMIAASERSRKALQIGTQRRHSAKYKTLIDTIRTAPIGKILQSSINSYRGDWRVPLEDEYPPGVPYWRMDQAKCGGVVYEMGAHIIDANNWIFDSDPLSVTSLQGVNNFSLRTRDSMDHAGVVVNYSNGSLMTYGGNLYNYGSAPNNYLYAVNGTVEFSEDQDWVTIHYGRPRGFPEVGDLPKPLEQDLPGEEGTTQQWRYFAKVLAGKVDPYPDGYAGRQTIQICEGSVLSAQEGCTIAVNELG